MKKAIPAIILGFISLAIGFTGYGGYIFAIPALILGILAARETRAPRVIGVIAIVFGCIGIVEATAVLVVEKPPEKIIVPHPTPALHHIYGTASTEVAVKNWGINVTPPTYTETFYEDSRLKNEYHSYKSRRGYRFALVKIKAINHGKEEDTPSFYDIKLVTTEGLRYKEKSGFNHSWKSLKSPPTPLLKEFDTLGHVLPRESTEGYFYFQIPVNAVPEDLIFKHHEIGYKPWEKPWEVRIKLRPKI